MQDKLDEKYGPGLAISDYHLGVLYMLAVSSLSTYGILLAGWTIRILIRLCLFISWNMIRQSFFAFVCLGLLFFLGDSNPEYILSSSALMSPKLTPQNNVNANFITGFIDAEASFIVMIKKQPAYKIGWKVEVKFTMGLHKKDKALLELIQSSW